MHVADFPAGFASVRLMRRLDDGSLVCRGRSYDRAIFEGTLNFARNHGDDEKSLFIEEDDNNQLELAAYALERTRTAGLARVEGTTPERENHSGAGEVTVRPPLGRKPRPKTEGVRHYPRTLPRVAAEEAA